MNDGSVMTLPPLTVIVWAIGFLLQAALLAVLVVRDRWRKHPLFTCYIAYDMLQSVVLFLSNTPYGIHVYRNMYWATLYADHLFELLVVGEIAYACFHRDGHWASGTRLPLIIMVVTAPVLSLCMSLIIMPPYTTGRVLVAYRWDLCASLVVCYSLAIVSWLVTRQRVAMRSHLRAVWLGFVLSAGLAAIKNVVAAAIGSFDGESLADYVLTISTVGVLVFWLVRFSSMERVGSRDGTLIHVAIEQREII